MGCERTSFTIGDESMTLAEVRTKLIELIGDSAHRDGTQYSGDIGSLSVSDFKIQNITLSVEEFWKLEDDIEKWTGAVRKVKNKEGKIEWVGCAACPS